MLSEPDHNTRRIAAQGVINQLEKDSFLSTLVIYVEILDTKFSPDKNEVLVFTALMDGAVRNVVLSSLKQMIYNKRSIQVWWGMW